MGGVKRGGGRPLLLVSISLTNINVSLMYIFVLIPSTFPWRINPFNTGRDNAPFKSN